MQPKSKINLAIGIASTCVSILLTSPASSDVIMDWNAKAEGFEHADVNIVTEDGTGIVTGLNQLTPSAEFKIGSCDADTISGCLTISSTLNWPTTVSIWIGLRLSKRLAPSCFAPPIR